MRKALTTLLMVVVTFFLMAGTSHAAEACTINGTVTRRPNGNFNLGVSVNTTQLDTNRSYSITLDTGVRDSVNHSFTPVAGTNGVNFAFELDPGHADNNYTLYVRPSSCVDVAGSGCAVQQCTTRVFFSPEAPVTGSTPTEEEVLPDNAGEPVASIEAYRFCQQVPEGSQRRACRKCVGGDGDDVAGHIYTAVGCLRLSQDGLAGDLIRLFLSIAGGVALMSILFAGLTFVTSQGDTNKVKQAKELLTAAVSGLMFIIFSVIILNFMGVQILRIPGLS